MRVVLTLAILALAIPGWPQSLAEVAAKEAARRAAIKEPARVITEKDLPAARTVAAKPAPVKADGGKASAASAPPSATTKTDDNGHDERWWNARVRPLLQKLDGAAGKLERARARAEAIAAVVKRSPPAARAAAIRRLQNAATEVDRLAGEVADAQRALEDLEEEARKAGALPGWLRK